MRMRSMPKSKRGFTLIELLVVVAILGILAAIGLTGFRTAQMRGRDAQRKSDLKQMSNAVELYYQDYKRYPATLPAGGDEFKDTHGTIYLKVMPRDPGSGIYVYRVSSSGNKYQLFALLENTEDKNLIAGLTLSCGGANCNFAITSPNTTAAETLP